MTPTRQHVAMAAILSATVLLRLVRLDQPIVENYVGRQVPTAMVARNLDRDGLAGFLDPRLDTGPFPNRFLVEPPVYAALSVFVKRATGLELPTSGRITSALATGLACWGLAGLVGRRSGPTAGLLAAAAFGLFPITIRYGRAFQPDMLAVGLTLAGLRLFDEGGRARAILGWGLLAAGLATKVLFAFALVPTIVCGDRGPRPSLRTILPRVALRLATLIPAALWYAFASTRFADGSRAAFESAEIWGRALIPSALLEPTTWVGFLRYWGYRSFTPIATVLAAWALLRGRTSRYWWVWGLSALGMLGWLSAKSHQEYYWLALAPAMAAGSAAGFLELAGRGRFGRALAWIAGLSFAGLGLFQSLPTWRTPPEWSRIGSAAEVIHQDSRRVDTSLIVAREAVLFEADRRGYRLESEPASARRAAGEFGETLPDGADPGVALVEMYRRRGASIFADVGDPARGRLRGPLHEAIRRRYSPIVADEPGLLVVRLVPRPVDERFPP